jgi:hypothetical protein
MKSGNLNFVEPSGPLQACNGTALLYLLIMSALYIREQGCEDPCILFEAKWVRQQEILITNNLVLLIFNHLFNDTLCISGCIATNGRVNSE